ncbi:hypothetical protein [Mucilaginibacter polytrichastri]|uniref:Uncharacterized protein n=1 Tax=Mucilaginibacter polytrichastri TaxID=1302689 RepID=A0A1Q5ZSA7_9SPHI|nr:hypothetical protein [Mucilaginibacter polytrichastri]OKS84558.1 hypothetical protein RG47T_5248 [Mucilaginibacter polytrichastri]SFT23970.1 hypothetical protein SAMN04487890_12162 [Mucilaginibacter polytrichastri]
MNNDTLHIIAEIRQKLNDMAYDSGELSGNIVLDETVIPQLILLSEAGVIEDMLPAEGTTIAVKLLQAGQTVALTIYAKQLSRGIYYDSVAEFVKGNPGTLPAQAFYIADIAYFSDQGLSVPAMAQFADIARLISLLTELSDYIQTGLGKNRTLIFFQKKKLNVPLTFDSSQLREIPYLDKLESQLHEAHDKEERKTIFKTELVSSLQEVPAAEVFDRLLSDLDQIYEHYLQSHLLYLEKFSYQDLKAAVDKDQLEYTKKIYNTVNDIQSKLIAVPAAFLLIFAQFDFTGAQLFKNVLIFIGAVLFAILIDILLRNQFGVLSYIRTELESLKTNLKNKDTQVDLSAFITSFAGLEPIMAKQRNYLLFFRLITWLVPAVTFIMLLIFTHTKVATAH